MRSWGYITCPVSFSLPIFLTDGVERSSPDPMSKADPFHDFFSTTYTCFLERIKVCCVSLLLLCFVMMMMMVVVIMILLLLCIIRQRKMKQFKRILHSPQHKGFKMLSFSPVPTLSFLGSSLKIKRRKNSIIS